MRHKTTHAGLRRLQRAGAPFRAGDPRGQPARGGQPHTVDGGARGQSLYLCHQTLLSSGGPCGSITLCTHTSELTDLSWSRRVNRTQPRARQQPSHHDSPTPRRGAQPGMHVRVPGTRSGSEHVGTGSWGVGAAGGLVSGAPGKGWRGSWAPVESDWITGETAPVALPQNPLSVHADTSASVSLSSVELHPPREQNPSPGRRAPVLGKGVVASSFQGCHSKDNDDDDDDKKLSICPKREAPNPTSAETGLQETQRIPTKLHKLHEPAHFPGERLRFHQILERVCDLM